MIRMRYKLIRADEFSLIKEENARLKRTMVQAVAYVEELQKGNYGQQTQAEDDPICNSLQSLASTLARLGEKEKQRKWQSEGLALFMDILKNGTDDLNMLSEKIITALVKYLNANQGGFFIVDKQERAEPVLRLTGCYAYGRKKFLEKEIGPGQGILGQAYLEKSFVYMTQVPEKYTTITSGLGDATPRSILIVPLKNNGEVMALVELASFELFEDYQVQFIEKLGENIASVIGASIISGQTERLLKASQQHTEELKAQEEEMRQNMEELKAMHENQSRLQNELNVRLQELEAAKKQIEAFKEAEAEKMKRQNAVQTKIMNAALEKFKKKEAELLERITAQQHELDVLKNPGIVERSYN